MFAHSIKQVEASMFPIFRFSQLAPGQMNIAAVATGFFVSAAGHFVTVAHVNDGAPANSKLVYWGRLPSEVINPTKDIQQIAVDDDRDIYIGRVVMKRQSFLRLSAKAAPIGRTVCIGGYTSRPSSGKGEVNGPIVGTGLTRRQR